MTLNQPQQGDNSRLKILAVILTILGLGLFGYFIYEAGINEIWNGIRRLGWGFLLLIALYAVKLATRAAAWMLSLEKPYQLRFLHAYRAVIMGEALTAIIPLGVFTSGTTKAIAVRKKLPLVVALSSVAIENLFYSLSLAVLFLSGGVMFLWLFHPTGNAALASYGLIAIVTAVIIGGFLMIIYEWRFASSLANWLYNRNIAVRLLHSGRAEVARFENLIYGFYRHQPNRFFPILVLEALFHLFGILEVWIILDAISDVAITFQTSLLLESVNHIVLFVFKLIPFALGVDEAGARFITDALELGAGVGVTMAVIRKGRVLVWTFLGVIFIAQSGFSLGEINAEPKTAIND
jgi:hypothetical protein